MKEKIRNLSKKSLLIIFGVIIGSSVSVFAAINWEGTDWISNGSVISSEKIKSNFDYLYERLEEVSNLSNSNNEAINNYIKTNVNDKSVSVQNCAWVDRYNRNHAACPTGKVITSVKHTDHDNIAGLLCCDLKVGGQSVPVIDGKCGSANQTCDAGILSRGYQDTVWSCLGINGGNTVWCDNSIWED